MGIGVGTLYRLARQGSKTRESVFEPVRLISAWYPEAEQISEARYHSLTRPNLQA
jgi:hypothetical protein